MIPVTCESISRVLKIGVPTGGEGPDMMGSALILDRGDKQYLVTAYHVIENLKGTSIYLPKLGEKNGRGKPVEVKIIDKKKDPIDIAVLSCSEKFPNLPPLESTIGGIGYGQCVHLLGFPEYYDAFLNSLIRYGIDGRYEHHHSGYPVPISVLGTATMLLNFRVFLVSAHVNAGMSGGPMVFKDVQGGRVDKVAGIITRVVYMPGKPVLDGKFGGEETGMYYQENPNLVIVASIKHVTDMIDSRGK